MKYCLGFLLLTSVAISEEFSRYQPIIDRSPFGPVVASGVAEVAPGFAQRYQFVALVTSNAGAGLLQAIIFDRDTNRSYFRAQGETLDRAVRVERIDVDPPKLVLKSGLETAQLSFQARPATPVAAVAPGMPSRTGAPPTATPYQPGSSGPPAQIGQPDQPSQPSGVRRIPFRRGNS
jgi:hypothetical protein